MMSSKRKKEGGEPPSPAVAAAAAAATLKSVGGAARATAAAASSPSLRAIFECAGVAATAPSAAKSVAGKAQATQALPRGAPTRSASLASDPSEGGKAPSIMGRSYANAAASVVDVSVSPAGAGNLAVEEQPAQASLDDGKSTAGARDGNNADSDVVVAEVLTGVPLSSVDLDLDIENKELPDDADGQLEEEKGEVEPEPTLAELIARAANDDAAMDLCIAANATTQPACEQVVQEGASAGDGRGVVQEGASAGDGHGNEAGGGVQSGEEGAEATVVG